MSDARERRRERLWTKQGILDHLDKKPLTYEEFENQLDDQDYECAICGMDLRIRRARAAADHAHIRKNGNGPFRAVLCFRCNRSLGTFERTGKCKESYLRGLLEAYVERYGGGR